MLGHRANQYDLCPEPTTLILHFSTTGSWRQIVWAVAWPGREQPARQGLLPLRVLLPASLPAVPDSAQLLGGRGQGSSVGPRGS